MSDYECPYCEEQFNIKGQHEDGWGEEKWMEQECENEECGKTFLIQYYSHPYYRTKKIEDK